MVSKLNESEFDNIIDVPDSVWESMYLDEGVMDGLFTPPDLKAVLKSLKKLNQCVDELSDFDNNKWLNRDKVLPLLSDSRSSLANIFKHYELLTQGW